jgi:hypothetical protein
MSDRHGSAKVGIGSQYGSAKIGIGSHLDDRVEREQETA